MGAEVIMRLKGGEAKKLKPLLEKMKAGAGGGGYTPTGGVHLVGPGVAHTKGWFPDCWIEWRGAVLQVGHRSGFGNDDWALAVAMAIAKRFTVVKGGFDSVGYCKDVKEFLAYRPFDHYMNTAKKNIRRMRAYEPDKDCTAKDLEAAIKIQNDEIAHYRKCQAAYEQAAEEVFQMAELEGTAWDKGPAGKKGAP